MSKREIKFRAWDKKAEEMFTVNVLTLISDGSVKRVVGHNLSELNEEQDGEIPLMQYTGLKDKNSKEIYEGDIVEFPADTQLYQAKVVYSNDAFCCVVQHPTKKETIKYGVNLITVFGIEIIGNIYENPELLKV